MPYIDLAKQDPKEVCPGYFAKFVHTENLTIAYWDVKAGFTLGDHNHVNQQVSHVLEGEFILKVEGVEYRLTPGEVFVIPPFAWHSGTSVTNCRLMDVFFPVREDYKEIT